MTKAKNGATVNLPPTGEIVADLLPDQLDHTALDGADVQLEGSAELITGETASDLPPDHLGHTAPAGAGEQLETAGEVLTGEIMADLPPPDLAEVPTLPADVPEATSIEDDALDASAEDLPAPASQEVLVAEDQQKPGDMAWLLAPESAEEAIHFLKELGAVDPEGAARLAWPDLFPADLPPEAREPKLSEKDLRTTLADIEARSSDLTLPSLLKDLAAIAGALVDQAPDGSAKVSLHGVSVTAPSIRLALTNWCSKARRAVMSGEAA